MTYKVTKRVEVSIDYVADIEARTAAEAQRLAKAGDARWREGKNLLLGLRYLTGEQDDLRGMFHRLTAYRQFNREVARLARSQNVQR